MLFPRDTAALESSVWWEKKLIKLTAHMAIVRIRKGVYLPYTYSNDVKKIVFDLVMM